MSEAMQIVRRLLRVVGVAKLSLVDDSGDQQKAQVQTAVGGPEGVAEIIDQTVRLGDYGVASCPPDGSEAVVVYLGGRRSSGIIVATGHKASRPKGLKPGEAMLYNGLTGAWIKMDQNGRAHANCDVLVDGKVTAAHLVAQDGASGSFTTADGKTVTVVNGIITSIA